MSWSASLHCGLACFCRGVGREVSLLRKQITSLQTRCQPRRTVLVLLFTGYKFWGPSVHLVQLVWSFYSYGTNFGSLGIKADAQQITSLQMRCEPRRAVWSFYSHGTNCLVLLFTWYKLVCPSIHRVQIIWSFYSHGTLFLVFLFTWYALFGLSIHMVRIGWSFYSHGTNFGSSDGKADARQIQENLAHKKQRPPRTLQ